MLLHRHRVSTLLNRDKPTAWTVWYSKQPTFSDSNVEVESKEFAEDQVKRLGSSRKLGSLYQEKVSREHFRY